MDLEFGSYEPGRDGTNDTIIFAGKDGSRKIICKISKEALQDHFGCDDDDLEAFYYHRAEIQEIAGRKYSLQEFEPDGTIFVRSADVRNK